MLTSLDALNFTPSSGLGRIPGRYCNAEQGQREVDILMKTRIASQLDSIGYCLLGVTSHTTGAICGWPPNLTSGGASVLGAQGESAIYFSS